MNAEKTNCLALVLLSLGSLWSTTTTAGPIYSANAFAHAYRSRFEDPGIEFHNIPSSPTPVATDLVVSEYQSGAQITAQAYARSSRGSVGVFARGTVYAGPGGGGHTEARADALMRIDDLMISEIPGANPTPNPNGTVTVRLNLDVDGNIGANGQITVPHTGDNFAIAEAGIRFSVTLGGQSFHSIWQTAGYSNPGEPFFLRYINQSGIFDNQPVPTVDLPLNTPIALQMAMATAEFPGVGASAAGEPPRFCDPMGHNCQFGPHSANADALVDFGNSVGFATSGPVFDLPTGYTINSVSAGIVDNNFVIPEPSAILLSLVGIVGCWLIRNVNRSNEGNNQ